MNRRDSLKGLLLLPAVVQGVVNAKPVEVPGIGRETFKLTFKEEMFKPLSFDLYQQLPSTGFYYTSINIYDVGKALGMNKEEVDNIINDDSYKFDFDKEVEFPDVFEEAYR